MLFVRQRICGTGYVLVPPAELRIFKLSGIEKDGEDRRVDYGI